MLCLPSEHCTHFSAGILLISSDMNVPSGQLAHTLPPAKYLPGMHATQWSNPVPAVVMYLPAAHVMIGVGARVAVLVGAPVVCGGVAMQASGVVAPKLAVYFLSGGHE